ncbi:MAG: hypoxanthine phosphoribosyltransferase [Clostridia bacterium]|nr:hypoxanthine phosphoribosyltransferase [Clostridia bacterium]
MYDYIEKVLISEEELKEKTIELAHMVSNDYKDKKLLVISILKGGFVFTADFIRALSIDVTVDFMSVSSYGAATRTSGVVQIRKDLDNDIKGLDVLICEDILDTGLTLSYLKKILIARGAKTVKICTILNKPDRRVADIEPDYVGFDIPDEFVVGYGLDFAEKYRNLPFVGILKPEVYAEY